MEHDWGNLLIKQAAKEGLTPALITQLEDGELHELCDALGFPVDMKTRQAIKAHFRYVALTRKPVSVSSSTKCAPTVSHASHDLHGILKAAEDEDEVVQPCGVESFSDNDAATFNTLCTLWARSRSTLATSMLSSETQNSVILSEETRHASCASAMWRWVFVSAKQRISKKNRVSAFKPDEMLHCGPGLHGRHGVGNRIAARAKQIKF
jgi:hypothetical protein